MPNNHEFDEQSQLGVWELTFALTSWFFRRAPKKEIVIKLNAVQMVFNLRIGTS